MLRCTLLCRLIVHSPKAIAFSKSSDDAIQSIREKYGSRSWFGASTQFLDVKPPSAEFLPFFFCKGRVNAVFTGTVSYSSSTRSDRHGSVSSSSHYVTTQPIALRTIFTDNQTQMYGGYKYNIKHVHSALRDEESPLRLRKLHEVDLSCGSINLFEQSINTLKDLVEEEVKRQVIGTAEEMVRSYHTSASSVSINFTTFEMHLTDVTPVFVPCFVVKTEYDAQVYNIYVGGVTGTVGGPFLINALHVGRVSALGTLVCLLFFIPNKVLAVVAGSVCAIPAYYAAFFAAKYYPSMMRDWQRKQRAKLQESRRTGDSSGFRPDTKTKKQRITEEYHRSTYWDNHDFESKKTYNTQRTLKDTKRYYQILGVQPDASVNEIRSAFRQRVLSEHPDAGGSTERMAQLNEAYRVLRDPALREKYDRSTSSSSTS